MMPTKHALLAVTLLSLTLFGGSKGYSDGPPPIHFEDLDAEIKTLAGATDKERLPALVKFLGGMGMEIRLLKGDRFTLPMKAMAVVTVGTVELRANDGSKVWLKRDGAAFLGYDGIWRKPSQCKGERFRISIVVSQRKTDSRLPSF
ncbi:MAG: hypothetical protein AAF802_16640 [Planctomycetota bacterium]